MAAQDGSVAQQFPVLLTNASAPAIDRGLRESDLPRGPGSWRTRLARGQADAALFLRGSIIVKFRAGTTVGAQRAMLARVNGAASPALAYAAFDIVSIDPSDDP